EGDLGDRKAAHLDICVGADRYSVETGSTLLERVRLAHTAIPEVSYDEIDTRTEFLGYPISMPLLISSMTGGSAGGYAANKELAVAAQKAGVPVGMGSIRILFRKPEVADHFRLKDFAPDVPVLANIGGVQTRELDHTELFEWIRKLGVDGLAVHLNPGQELSQEDGDRDFRGVLDAIGRLCDRCPVPVIVKETGFGIGPNVAARLLDAGASYINVAGAGGTNWVQVERYRLPEALAEVAAEFENWGIPTGILVKTLADRRIPTIASGGLRSGMDLAKCIALGAKLGGFALPLIREVTEGGSDAVVERINHYRAVLRTVMTLTGSSTLDELADGKAFYDSVFTDLETQYLTTQ
ncbi:MAG: type 2 isopentenyl-diphosphate Delta-isomerase, partial [Spirochaetales bacterium]